MQIISIGSGKGGVGKSTITVGIAMALRHLHKRVGILDADIYGPSIPTLIGKQEVEQKHLKPVFVHDIPTMSIAYLAKRTEAMMWRGPMVSKTFSTLWQGTEWGELDYLLIDLPPGTGDVLLTLAKSIPLASVVLVTSLHSLALADIQRALSLFQYLHVRCLGMICNMAYFNCSCGATHHIFGEDKMNDFLSQNHLDLLGTIPIERAISHAVKENSLCHKPEMIPFYLEIARKLCNLMPH